jgi:hypothetical protein
MTWSWLTIALTCAACGNDSTPALSSPDAPTDRTVTLETTPFILDPGVEVTKCQSFANPLGADFEVRAFESHESIGTHHMFLTTSDSVVDPPDAPLADCTPGVAAEDVILYGSQIPDNELAFPPGVGVLAPQHQGLKLQIHYLNASDSAVTVSAQVVMHLAEPGTITQQAGVVIFANERFVIPSSPTQSTISHTCSVPANMNLIVATGHMHHHGIDLTASLNGAPLYETTTWSDPPQKFFDPPLALAQGDRLDWSCTFENDTGNPISYGVSAAVNEMCNVQTRVYPVPKLPNGSFTCL